MCLQHVDEVTEIFLRCLEVIPDQPVATDLTTGVSSMDDLLTAIRAEIPDAEISANPTPRPAPSAFDNSPLKTLIGEWEAVPLEEGVRRTIRAFRE
jgi:nucleoside-diphosphate-sugar epimerase